jgi:hypothetical protein
MALTLWQPWASLVAIGAKRYETRHWKTKYRGILMIHAANRWNRDLEDFAYRFRQYEIAARLPEKLPLGAIVCAVRLVDCHKTEAIRGELSAQELAFGNYDDGRWAWELEVIRVPSEPIRAKGGQGLWKWTEG